MGDVTEHRNGAGIIMASAFPDPSDTCLEGMSSARDTVLCPEMHRSQANGWTKGPETRMPPWPHTDSEGNSRHR